MVEVGLLAIALQKKKARTGDQSVLTLYLTERGINMAKE